MRVWTRRGNSWYETILNFIRITRENHSCWNKSHWRNEMIFVIVHCKFRTVFWCIQCDQIMNLGCKRMTVMGLCLSINYCFCSFCFLCNTTIKKLRTKMNNFVIHTKIFLPKFQQTSYSVIFASSFGILSVKITDFW